MNEKQLPPGRRDIIPSGENLLIPNGPGGLAKEKPAQKEAKDLAGYFTNFCEGVKGDYANLAPYAGHFGADVPPYPDHVTLQDEALWFLQMLRTPAGKQHAAGLQDIRMLYSLNDMALDVMRGVTAHIQLVIEHRRLLDPQQAYVDGVSGRPLSPKDITAHNEPILRSIKYWESERIAVDLPITDSGIPLLTDGLQHIAGQLYTVAYVHNQLIPVAGRMYEDINAMQEHIQRQAVDLELQENEIDKLLNESSRLTDQIPGLHGVSRKNSPLDMGARRTAAQHMQIARQLAKNFERSEDLIRRSYRLAAADMREGSNEENLAVLQKQHKQIHSILLGYQNMWTDLFSVATSIAVSVSKLSVSLPPDIAGMLEDPNAQ